MCVSVRIPLNCWLSHVGLSHVKPFTVKKDCNECWQRYLWLTALFCHWSSMWKAKPGNGDHSSFCLTNLAKTLMWNVWPCLTVFRKLESVLLHLLLKLLHVQKNEPFCWPFHFRLLSLWCAVPISVWPGLVAPGVLGKISDVYLKCFRMFHHCFIIVSPLFHHGYRLGHVILVAPWLLQLLPVLKKGPFWSASASLSVQCPLECVPRCLVISAKKS